jgi:RNA polymerase sigma factor (TIGR02999 family)
LEKAEKPCVIEASGDNFCDNLGQIDLEQSINSLLAAWHDGDRLARDALVTRLHPELYKIAAARLRAEPNSSLSTGDLINDAIIRLIGLDRMDFANRAHFIALASTLMRQILVDYARARITDKRAHQKVELNSRVEGEQKFDLNMLDSALIRLGAINMDLAELVEMRYFGGMTLADIADVTGVSEATVKRRWQTARAWLTDALANPIDAI